MIFEWYACRGERERQKLVLILAQVLSMSCDDRWCAQSLFPFVLFSFQQQRVRSHVAMYDSIQLQLSVAKNKITLGLDKSNEVDLLGLRFGMD